MLSINTNISDLVLLQNFNYSTMSMNEALERLTTGYKINQAKDNAANYSIVNDLSKRISSMLQVQNNAEDGISLLSTAEGGLSEINDLLQKLRELTMQASDGTFDSKSRDAMQAEADAIISEIMRLKNNVNFNGINLYEKKNNNETLPIAQLARSVNLSQNYTVRSGVLSDTYPNASEENMTSSSDAFSSNEAPTTITPRTMMMSAAPASVVAEGAVDFAGTETKTITIDGVNYTVTNRQGVTATLSYSKDSSGQITFIGNNFKIVGQDGVSHNLLINGGNNLVYGGNLDDRLQIYDNGVNMNNAYTCLYGMAGDDILISVEAGSSNYHSIYGGSGNDTLLGAGTLHGEAGDDEFTASTSYYSVMHGGDDNDTFNISSSIASSAYGGAGDDHFEVGAGTVAHIISGGSGNNTINDLGTNTIKADVPGANAYLVQFGANETKNLVINNINYEVKNNLGSARDFIYAIADDGTINFNSSSYTIYGDINTAHKVLLNASALNFVGGNLADNIIMTHNTFAKTLAGDDIITVNSGASYIGIETGDGEDTINSNSPLLYSSVNTGNDNDTVNILSYGKTFGTDFYLGDGDDTISFRTSDSYYLSINGGNGDNTITGTVVDSSLYGFGDGLDNMDGFVELAPEEYKTIKINGVNYNIQNRITRSTVLTYGYNNVTGEVTFGGYNVSIFGQKDSQHNVVLLGKNLTFTGGDLDDNIISNCYASIVYGGNGDDYIVGNLSDSTVQGGAGDDTLISNAGVSLMGQEGNDTLTTNTTMSSASGGVGDDTYYLNRANTVTDTAGNNIYHINSNSMSITGSSGNDTFYVKGNNNTVNGAGGNDYFIVTGTGNNIIDGGTGDNYYVDKSEGNANFSNVTVDPNSGFLAFSALDEVQELEIDNKKYIITNKTSSNNELMYSFNPNTGILSLDGSDFEIVSADNQVNNIILTGDNNIYTGSNLADIITLESGSNNKINTLTGNDNVTINDEENSVDTADGADTISLNATTSKQILAGSGADKIVINSTNNTSIDAGDGDDNISITKDGNTVLGGAGNDTLNINSASNSVDLGEGNNSATIIGNSNNLEAGNGSNKLKIEGANNSVNFENASGNIIIDGNGNNYTSQYGSETIEINGDGNILVSGAGSDKVTIKGSNNEFTTDSGTNNINVYGANNILQGGSGTDTIKITGNDNSAKGGAGNDKFTVNSGDTNIIDGESGANTLMDNGQSTNHSNVSVIKIEPFELDLKVGIGYDDSSIIKTQISLPIFELYVDLSSADTARESLQMIDDLILTVEEQLINIGTTINRLHSVIEEQSIKLENMISSRSTLRDADIAKVSSDFIRGQILQQASSTLLASTRNIRYENVLGLLQNL